MRLRTAASLFYSIGIVGAAPIPKTVENTSIKETGKTNCLPINVQALHLPTLLNSIRIGIGKPWRRAGQNVKIIPANIATCHYYPSGRSSILLSSLSYLVSLPFKIPDLRLAVGLGPDPTGWTAPPSGDGSAARKGKKTKFHKEEGSSS